MLVSTRRVSQAATAGMSWIPPSEFGMGSDDFMSNTGWLKHGSWRSKMDWKELSGWKTLGGMGGPGAAANAPQKKEAPKGPVKKK